MGHTADGPLSPQAALQLWVETHPPEFRLADGFGGAADWQPKLRERLWQLLGGRVDPARDLPKPELQLGTARSEDGYSARRLTYVVEAGVRAIALLLTPEPARRRPGGVLALHGHGPGKDLAVSAFGADLARRGFLVLVPEALGFGERADRTGSGCHTLGLASMLLGRPIAAQRLRDDVAALTLLRALAGTHRLAVVGHSEGGRRALLLGALDERASAIAISGYFTAIREEIVRWERLRGWDLCNALPGLLAVADLPELAALCLPRSLCIDWGRHDTLYTPDAVEQATTAVAAFYAGEGLGERCCVHGHDGGHQFGGGAVLDWLERELSR